MSDKPDDDEPTPERQAELCAAYGVNVAAGKAPYTGVEIRTRGELNWVIQQRQWLSLTSAPSLEPANLSGAILKGAHLQGAFLEGAVLVSADLTLTDLSGAHLTKADLSHAAISHATLRDATLQEACLNGAQLLGADLGKAILPLATLTRANLISAVLTDAQLQYCDLRDALLFSAHMVGANLSGARLEGADLSDADLRSAKLEAVRMDAGTKFVRVALSKQTRMADIIWDGVSLSRVEWTLVPMLGEEFRAELPLYDNGKPKEPARRIIQYQDALRATRQLATVLRSQGLSEDADRFTYRAQMLQREVLRRRRQWGPWLFSWVLWALSGYGYRLWRILAAYGVVMILFTALYWLMGVHSFPHEPGVRALWDSFLVSLSAIHGRTTFEQLGAWSFAAWAAAVESVFGIVIEGVFVAMLVQRFFAR